MKKNYQKSISYLEKNTILKLEEKYKNIPLLKSLNYDQKVCATRIGGNFLVIAGPGAGKTHTLLYRT